MTDRNINATHGRQRLIDAALQLSAQKRSFSSLSIREITRQAGLSAPAFYRHFEDLNALGSAVIDLVKADVLTAFTEVRRDTARQDNVDIRPMLLSRFFDYAVQNPTPIIVGTCEAYGPLAGMRNAMREAMRSIAEDISDDLHISRLMPGLSHQAMVEVLTIIAHTIFFMALDYVEFPDKREDIFQKAERVIVILFSGAIALTDAETE